MAMTAFEKRILWLTLAGIILAVVTGYIFYRQFREMSTQTGILSQQAKTAHDDSIDAGKKADAQIAALEIQASAATKSLQVLQDQFQQEQRPYIVLERIPSLAETKPAPPQIGKPIMVNLYFRNIGKSPALSVHIHRHIIMGVSTEFSKIEPIDKCSTNTLVPGEMEWVTATSVKNTWAAESIVVPTENMVPWNGEEFIVFGRVTYQDRAGNKYCTSFTKVPIIEGGVWASPNTDLCPKGYRN